MRKSVLRAMALGAVLSISLFGCGKEEEPLVSVEIGSHMNFGSYQGEEIDWRVLAVKGGNVLLLSEYGLDVKPYHEEKVDDISWEDCSLRKWLNEDFYEAAFSAEEKEQIVATSTEGFPAHNYHSPGDGKLTINERPTEDKVCLLTYTEACEYLSAFTETDHKKDCQPTAYAQGNENLRVYNGICGWWLSSTKRYYGNLGLPMSVSRFSSFDVENNTASMENAVRPAIWISGEGL